MKCIIVENTTEGILLFIKVLNKRDPFSVWPVSVKVDRWLDMQASNRLRW